MKKNRKAYYLNSCVSPTNRTEEYDFVNADGVGGIKGNIILNHKRFLIYTLNLNRLFNYLNMHN